MGGSHKEVSFFKRAIEILYVAVTALFLYGIFKKLEEFGFNIVNNFGEISIMLVLSFIVFKFIFNISMDFMENAYAPRGSFPILLLNKGNERNHNLHKEILERQTKKINFIFVVCITGFLVSVAAAIFTNFFL